MDISKEKKKIEARFAAPLPEYCRRRIVFWQDDDGEFSEGIAELELENAKVLVLDGSNYFYAKKRLLSDEREENFLVYCPFSPEREEDALLDIRLYSEEYRSDLVSEWINELGLTEHPAVRKTLKEYRTFFNSKERLSRVAAFASEITSESRLRLAILSGILREKELSPALIIASVLSKGMAEEGNSAYADILKYNAAEDFWALAKQGTGYDPSEERRSLEDLALQVFLSAEADSFPEGEFSDFGEYIASYRAGFCEEILKAWEEKDPASLKTAASSIEKRLLIRERCEKLGLEATLESEYFPYINEFALKSLIGEEEAPVDPAAVRLALEKRRTKLWYSEYETYYLGLYALADMQDFYTEHASGFHHASANELWKAYTSDYCRMDSYYRAFRLQFQTALKKMDLRLDEYFKRASEQAEKLYTNWYLLELGEAWGKLSEEELKTSGAPNHVEKQEDFYKNHVAIEENRVFVVISDALRYEVAKELSERLKKETQSELELTSMAGTFPSATKYGMAALLPHERLDFRKKDEGGIELYIGDTKTEGIKNREKILKAREEESAAIGYKELVSMKREERKEAVKGKRVVYIYHDRIDEIAHSADSDVFSACEDAMDEILALVRLIANDFGGTNILITADHGFLYTYKPLGEEDKLSPAHFEGKILEMGRRYVVTEKGAKADLLQQVFFQGGEAGLEGYAPRENVRLKLSGSGMNFVHGGASLQELCVPLIEYHYLRNSYAKYQKNREKIDRKPVTIKLLSAKRKISNMIFKLGFYQAEAVSGNLDAASYLLYFVNEAGERVSDEVKIIADREAADIRERQFEAGFKLKQMKFDRKESYYLVIEEEEKRALAQKEPFTIDIAFAVEEFDFFS